MTGYLATLQINFVFKFVWLIELTSLKAMTLMM